MPILEARIAGGVTSATVPAPTDVATEAPKAWKILRTNNPPIVGGSAAKRVLATRKIAIVTR
ncbi:hypothetical protein RRF57_002758 [Xylaria bambusicola]|uniref:Uncharacterized protein n=1 Tax=Xylaria bambusicola TaxID=326684 RepID=A0AAN7UE35_9PEZI